MNRSGNALVTKELNINLVRETLKAMRQATKQQIAEATGLTTVTIAAILQQFIENHEVFEGGQVPSSGGRPSLQYRFNQNYAHVLVLFTHEQDGADMLYVRVANLFGECVYEQDEALQDITLRIFEPFIDSAVRDYPTIKAIGFGLPGIEREDKVVALDYPALVNTPFSEHYRTLYRLPVIFVNDVNAAVVGYCRRKQLESSAVYLYFPKKYTPGAGIYLNGGLYKGDGNYAGEVANLPLGINWLNPELYASPSAFCGPVAKLIAAVSSLLNPGAVILHGSFFGFDSLDLIRQNCSALLPQNSMPKLSVSGSFTLDYQNGMIEEALDLLKPHLSL